MLHLEGSFKNYYFFHERHHDLKPMIDHKLQEKGIEKHVCILSSGTTSKSPKGYAISESAIGKSAQAVNQALELKQGDRWGLSLPIYHIGGLAILARSQMLGTDAELLLPWSPLELPQKIMKAKVTVLSLVPTQVYDLVKLQVKAPATLKHLLVGGDFLSQALQKEAEALGWRIIRSFGMTEVASTLALGKDIQLGLLPLAIHRLRTDEDQALWIKSPSLYTAKFYFHEDWHVDLAQDSLDQEGFYPSADRVELKNGRIIPLGRMDGQMKSSGHLIPLQELKELLDEYLLKKGHWGEMVMMSISDERKGSILALHFETGLRSLADEFEAMISPLRIDEKREVPKLMRNELGKIKMS